jgi:hypothetical protein
VNRNPYEYSGSTTASPNRGTIFVLAGIGSALASLYWATLTLLIAVGVAAGSASGVQLILPLVLIGLYAARAFQIFKGDPNAARRVLWLHGVGGLMAMFQMFTGGPILIVLQGIKVVIHIFGAITAYLAQRS